MKSLKLALVTLILATLSLSLFGCGGQPQREETKNPPEVKKNKRDD